MKNIVSSAQVRISASRIALLRALTELNQFMSIGLMNGGTGEKPSLDNVTPLQLTNYPFLLPNGHVRRLRMHLRLEIRAHRRYLGAKRQVDACVDAVTAVLVRPDEAGCQ